ncbi:DUF418 domain-containing protein [Pseudokineococcus sp. 1T1Z-3]|uniref:DUF418 domain-containing protein n=1 Tax=Pseudokineococcus sp. 1T1Z-3 TaxID=3132745 RepID=UPI003098FCB3
MATPGAVRGRPRPRPQTAPRDAGPLSRPPPEDRGAAPTATDRLLGVDAARGLALVGMIVVNVGPMPPTSLVHRLYLLPYGRASLLFVVVAGIGAGLVAARALRRGTSRREVWSAALWRAAVLAALGLGLQELTDDIGVVLTLYAVLFLLAPVLGRLPTWPLVGLAAASLVLGPALVVLHEVLVTSLAPGKPPVQLGDPPGEMLLGLLVAGRYPLVTWVVPFVVGLLLARADLAARSTQRRLVGWGAVAAVGAFGASTLARALLGPTADEGFAKLLTGVAHGQMPLWLVSGVGGAAVVVGLAVRAGQARPALLRPLAGYGRLALTLYVLHVLVIVAWVPDDLTLAHGVVTSAALVVGTALVAAVWTRVGGPGPLERLARPFWAPAGGRP